MFGILKRACLLFLITSPYEPWHEKSAPDGQTNQKVSNIEIKVAFEFWDQWMIGKSLMAEQ